MESVFAEERTVLKILGCDVHGNSFHLNARHANLICESATLIMCWLITTVVIRTSLNWKRERLEIVEKTSA